RGSPRAPTTSEAATLVKRDHCCGSWGRSMTSDGELNSAELATEALRRLVDTCDFMESQWGADGGPKFEELLASFPQEEREHVLRELLHIDIELRRRAGGTPRLADYEA